jgi:hypothetical protein
MRVRLVVSKAAWVILSIVLAATIACDPSIRVEGTVHDRQGTPLEGVTVILQSEERGPHNTVTAKDGSFGIGIVGAEPRQTKLLFQKDGYKSLEMPLGNEYASKMNVTLEPEVR